MFTGRTTARRTTNRMKSWPIRAVALASLAVLAAGCAHPEEVPHETQKITATSPLLQPVTLTQRYVCQIHSRRHIKVRALEEGYLEAITVKEGQPVKAGDVLFKVKPILYQKKAEAEKAVAELTRLKLQYTQRLADQKVVSDNEVKLRAAELAKADAEAQLAQAELDFATVRAPFDGIVDHLFAQQGSLVEQGEVLTTLSDNSTMWVYFNVPEARYLEFMQDPHHDDLKIELLLANAEKFDQPGKIGAIEADFNNQTGNIPFRADFPNPHGLLRHGETGTVLLSRVQPDAVVIPQRATFEVLNKRYVYVIDKENVAQQREISIAEELEDIFVIEQGLSVNDKIVLEGIRQVRDGEKVSYEYVPPEQVVDHLKYHAE